MAIELVGTARPGRPAHFENLVFAGGGNRCFWQAGFWSVAADGLSLRPLRVAAVSAGAAVACALFSGRFDDGFARYKRAIAGNGSNIHLRRLLDQRSVFPHGRMYRDAILGCIDQGAVLRLHQGPEIGILVARPPSWADARLALVLGMIAVGVEGCNHRVHSPVGRRIGFTPARISVRECATPEALADVILASSCAPPLIPRTRRHGVALFDGGLVSDVPTDGLAEEVGETLVLLTRRFATLPAIPGRTYVQPSRPVPVAAWDYTDDAALQAAYDLGQRDGERFCSSVQGRC